MKIPFLDLSSQTRSVLESFLDCVRGLSLENQFVGGRAVEEFEHQFGAYCGADFCVAVNSGTDGLRLALTAAGIGPEDEVVTSPFTFIATSEAVSQTGRLVLADIDSSTFTLSPAAVEERITQRLKAILPVHIFGLPAAMPELLAVGQRHNLLLIEDACQAHGASIGGKKVGTFGEAAAFSFYPTKILGAFGDAGAVTTGQRSIAGRIRLLRNHGQVGTYQHDEEGYNSRMDALQAVVLTLKLGFLEQWISERRRLATLYRNELEELEEIRFQCEPPDYRHSYYLLAALVERRSELKEHLARLGIETKVVYPAALHLQKAYRHLNYGPRAFPKAEEVCRKVLCFPLYPGLGEDQVADVVQAIRHFYNG